MIRRAGPRKGVYLLPNLLTTAALFAGFFAVIKSVEGAFVPAAVAALVALVFDGLDGRVARLINAETDFGAEYDSISDAISFGLAPAVLIYQWALQPFGNVGWLGGFLFTACAGLRLARFNTQSGVHDKRYFQGLPVPAGAAALGTWVLFVEEKGFSGVWVNLATLFAVYVVALLMVSNVRYRSFKDADLRYRVPFPVAVLVVGLLILVAVDPPLVLFGFFFVYALAGPVATVLQLRRRRRERRARSEVDSPDREN
ncbi:MAG TPA: CDP-diacylglycerol--serine O-phosphatidyltransferase [Gammaproteobacteria bacterium]|nr:CDP-diacylglycerol--serine O-phosphatidyltransferase [Gammaproteobacteria bacterium]